MRQWCAVFALLLFVLGVAGCHLVTEFDESEVPTTERRTLIFDQRGNAAGVDLLVVVDTRNATELEGFDEGLRMFLMGVLQTFYLPEDGQLENIEPIVGSLHLGFVSSDMGTTGADPLPQGCTEHGHGGSLIPPLLPQGHQGHYLQPFLVLKPDPEGGPGEGSMQVLNYRDALGDASEIPFAEALAHLWAGVEAAASSCPFQQPINAAKRAVEYHVNNLGFYREDAALGVLFISPEDDCSANPNDATALFSDDPGLGPLDDFRCFAHGVQCPGQDLASPGVKNDCQDLSPYDGDGEDDRVMIPTESYRAYFEAKKSGHPFGSVLFPFRAGSIAVELSPQGAPQLQPMMDCSLDDFSIYPFIYPAVRLQSFVDVDVEAVVDPFMCDMDWMLPGFELGYLLQAQTVDQCLGDKLVDTDPTLEGIQPDCSVRLVNFVGADEQLVAELQPCDSTSNLDELEDCWRVEFRDPGQDYDVPPYDDPGNPPLVPDQADEPGSTGCQVTLVVEPPDDLDISQYEAVVAECTYSLL